MTLARICGPIESELNDFEIKFKEALHSDVSLAEDVTEYITRRKGKRLRPILVFLTALLHGRVTEWTMQAAIVVELLHTATLIHDDVVDVSHLRRGAATIHSIWSNKISILIGDFLFSKSLKNIADLNDKMALSLLSTVTERMIEGELLQIERSRDYEITEEVYFRLISNKTGSLLSAACSLGALSVSRNDAAFQQMKNFGEVLGIAFQIKDDILDFVGNEKKLGKPVGNDIRENKITLPLIAALRNAPKTEHQRILSRLGDNSDDESILQVIEFVNNYGGMVYAETVAEKYINQAFEFLQQYQPGPAKSSLYDLITFVTTRTV